MPLLEYRNNPEFDTIAYRIKPGDSVIRIIESYYGKLSHTRLSKLVQKVKRENRLTDPDRIHPGQLLKIDVPVQYCAAPPSPYSPLNTEVQSQDDLWYDLINHNWKSATKAEKDWAMTLAPLFLGAGGAKLTMIDKTFSSNTPLLQDMVRNYEDYKAGELSKGQYDYRRGKLIGQFQSNLGPTTRVLNPTRRQSEVMRISRRKGQVPTEAINKQISRLQTASKVASKGGLVLSVAGLGLACHQIAHTDDRIEKNEILIESSAGFLGGVAYGIGASITILALATPVGWVAGLAIGIGGAIVGYGSGQLAKKYYNARGEHIDFASIYKVDQMCAADKSQNANLKKPLISKNPSHSFYIFNGSSQILRNNVPARPSILKVETSGNGIDI